jgi:hypothetical protein
MKKYFYHKSFFDLFKNDFQMAIATQSLGGIGIYYLCSILDVKSLKNKSPYFQIK